MAKINGPKMLSGKNTIPYMLQGGAPGSQLAGQYSWRVFSKHNHWIMTNTACHLELNCN